MKKNRAIKYRIYPTETQAVLFAKTFGCCRKIWNLMLDDKIAFYNENGKMLQTTPAQYKSEYPYLKEVDSLALANVQLDLQRAYKAFFENKKIGFPKYKSSKHSSRSYTTNNQNGTVAIVDDKHIKLPKVGIVKAVIHRQPEPDWILKSATVRQKPDGTYYASLLFEYEVPDEVNKPLDLESAIGLDYKSDGLYMDSDGNIGSNHKFYRESQDKLAKKQRKLKNKQVGSRNYEKAQRDVAKVQCHVANQRLDNLHKKSTEIANQYDVVCVEDLDMKAIANRNFHNGKATYDNGYGMFLKMLEYKQEDRGHKLVRVDKYFPSTQICCRCGKKNKMKLGDRIYKCECGNIMDRDWNSSINIKNEGLRMIRDGLV